MERRLKRYADTISNDTSHSSFSIGSPSTKRRKTLRRINSANKSRAEMDALRSHFQFINILGRTDAYAKLSKELAVADPDPEVVGYSLLHPPPIDGFKMEEWTFVKACTPVEMAHLKHFDRPVRNLRADRVDVIRRAANLVADLLDLPGYLHFPERQDLALVSYYPGKFAGIEYASIGLKTRREANDIAQVDAESAWEKLLGGERVAPHDVRLGGRGKVTKMMRQDAELVPPPVGRLILMMSHRDLKLMGVTENQLTRAYCAPQFPVAVGQSWFHGDATAFIRRFHGFKRYYCFDAKKFDSSIDPWMVRMAINILRNQYLDGHNARYDAYWQMVDESLLRAPIYRDDGVRLQKFVGTTSGHSHNTLIQSVITLILGYAAVMLANPGIEDAKIRANVWVESLGDDNIIGIKGPVVESTVEDIAGIMQDSFGIDWWGKKSFSTTRLMDPTQGEFEGIQFLGKYFYLGEYPLGESVAKIPLPYRPFQETYLRLLYPEYGDLVPEQSLLRALGNYLDGAGNSITERWIQGFLDYLGLDDNSLPSEWPANFKRMVSRDYSNVGIEVPVPKRIEYDEWRDLVILTREEYRKVWRDEPDPA